MLVGILDERGNKICLGRLKRDSLVVKNKVLRQVNGRLGNRNVSFEWQGANACFSKCKTLKLSYPLHHLT